jgi:hypothetical protein
MPSTAAPPTAMPPMAPPEREEPPLDAAADVELVVGVVVAGEVLSDTVDVRAVFVGRPAVPVFALPVFPSAVRLT